ncbi:hypothetical protein BASA81_001168 [Batrachochytrium salamandrivorans]|nr:hypothetical protein BASA81_001168 [Batrachochytrium salamandrivorans]
MNFHEFCALLVGVANWDSEEEFKEEDSEFVFKLSSAGTEVRVDKKQQFSFLLKNVGEVEYAAEQLVHFYRTKDLVVRDFLSTKTTFKKISVSYRSILGETIIKAATSAVDSSHATATSTGVETVSTTTTTSKQQDTTTNSKQSTEEQQARRNKRPSTHVGSSSSSSSALQDVLKLEVRYYDRNAALNATRSFQEVIDIDSRSKKLGEETANASAPSPATAASMSKRSKRHKASTAGSSGSPIIIVPPNSSAVINLYNCRQFLEDSHYVSHADLIKENQGVSLPKPESVYVTRRKHPLTGCDLRFKVVDSVLNFTNETWDRVVAVIVSGQAWQLKGWKWQTTQEIFANVKGLYVYFDDAKLPPQVQGWNVTPLAIKHHLRNKDIVRAHELWSQVDAHLVAHKPKLLRGLQEEAEIKLHDEREARKKGLQAQLELDEEEEQELAASTMATTAVMVGN